MESSRVRPEVAGVTSPAIREALSRPAIFLPGRRAADLANTPS
jgi:hypothetical protein